ncbi:hypothetical protein FGO68_gene15913 [Halteria grandinella]|uniref:Uncharacterized protein n=1 Tax=Halteria grandinella TaxID=5974 RepID=A0A8J8T124_HALGN|nr:hypothetical protein FGO68_gene15913 [Halteria grandinella]
MGHIFPYFQSSLLQPLKDEYEEDSIFEHGPFNIVKLILIGLKVLYLCAMMTITMIAYRKVRGTLFTFETFICSFFFIDMIAMLVFELTGKYIIFLYFLVLLSSMAGFVLYHRYLSNSMFAASQTQKPKRIIQELFLFFGLFAYIACFSLAFIHSLGADCTTTRIYPMIFGLLFLVNFMITLIVLLLYFCGFMNSQYFLKTSDGTELCAGGEERNQNVRTGLSQSVCDQVKSFEEQNKFFTIIFTALNTLGLAVGLLGLFVFDSSSYLGCSNSGLRWLYLSIAGNAFQLAHIVIIVGYCILCLRIVYFIPRKHGAFKEDIGELRDISTVIDN